MILNVRVEKKSPHGFTPVENTYNKSGLQVENLVANLTGEFIVTIVLVFVAFQGVAVGILFVTVFTCELQREIDR